MGETGLHKGSGNSHQPVVNELLEYVKRHVGKVEDFVNIPNNIGESSLHLASRTCTTSCGVPGEDVQIIQLLMKNGSDVFVQTKEVR